MMKSGGFRFGAYGFVLGAAQGLCACGQADHASRTSEGVDPIQGEETARGKRVLQSPAADSTQLRDEGAPRHRDPGRSGRARRGGVVPLLDLREATRPASSTASGKGTSSRSIYTTEQHLRAQHRLSIRERSRRRWRRFIRLARILVDVRLACAPPRALPVRMLDGARRRPRGERPVRVDPGRAAQRFPEGRPRVPDRTERIYTQGKFGEPGPQHFAPQKALDEQPEYVVFNGKVGSLTGAHALKAKSDEKLRVYFGNAGPNLVSSLHVVGEVFDSVYGEGGTEPSEHNVQVTAVPAGGARVVELTPEVAGEYPIIDHSLFRSDNKGTMGLLNVEGRENRMLFSGTTAHALYDPGTTIPKTVEFGLVEGTDGRKIFETVCATCHQAGGQGIPHAVPPLRSSDFPPFGPSARHPDRDERTPGTGRRERRHVRERHAGSTLERRTDCRRAHLRVHPPGEQREARHDRRGREGTEGLGRHVAFDDCPRGEVIAEASLVGTAHERHELREVKPWLSLQRSPMNPPERTRCVRRGSPGSIPCPQRADSKGRPRTPPSRIGRTRGAFRPVSSCWWTGYSSPRCSA